jgi:hypothetical protein
MSMELIDLTVVEESQGQEWDCKKIKCALNSPVSFSQRIS